MNNEGARPVAQRRQPTTRKNPKPGDDPDPGLKPFAQAFDDTVEVDEFTRHFCEEITLEEVPRTAGIAVRNVKMRDVLRLDD